jgi:hypothetical protein
MGPPIGLDPTGPMGGFEASKLRSEKPGFNLGGECTIFLQYFVINI